MIKELIEDSFKRKKEAPREYLGASSLGNACMRASWYGFNGHNASWEPKTLITFEIGKRLEKMILDALEFEDAGKNLKCDDIPALQGHIDALFTISGKTHVLEIKTANNANWMKIQRGGIRAVRPEYYDQVQLYMGMSGVHQAIILVINKDTSELYEVVVEFNAMHYEILKAKAKLIIESEKPLDRINDSPSYYLCKLCPYREPCHGG